MSGLPMPRLERSQTCMMHRRPTSHRVSVLPMTHSAMAKVRYARVQSLLSAFSRVTLLSGTGNPPFAVTAILQPNAGYGTSILYGIPVPYNPQFKQH